MDTPDQDWIQYTDVRLNTKAILNIVGESLAQCASRCDQQNWCKSLEFRENVMLPKCNLFNKKEIDFD